MDAVRMTYYLLKDSGLVARRSDFTCWIYRSFKWNRDTENKVMDKLMGFDPSEPADSPYAFGSTSVMDDIEEISCQEAMDLIGEQIISNLIHRWSKKFRKKKEKWDQNPGPSAGKAETGFCLFSVRYTLRPEDLEFEKGPEDDGFMASIRKELEADLAAAGAAEIESSGYFAETP